MKAPMRMHWPFGSNRYGWRAAYDSLEPGTLVRWRVVGRLIVLWGAVLCVAILALAAVSEIV